MQESLFIYVPKDEKFSHVKLSDFLAYGLKAIPQNLFPFFEAYCGNPPKEFTSFKEVQSLYDGPLSNCILDERLKSLFEYPTPQVIQSIKYSN